MTTDELRDSVAGLLGWKYRRVVNPAIEGTANAWCCGNIYLFYGAHPIDGTLDQVARLWREHCGDWIWGRMLYTTGGVHWYAYGPGYDSESDDDSGHVRVNDTGNEYTDRLALFHAVLVAEGRK